MGIWKQVSEALYKNLECEFVLRADDDPITAVAVSERFDGVSAFDRQVMIEEALAKAPHPLSPEELRKVLMIAALTPAEYFSAGGKVRVHRVRPIAKGVEVLVHGGVAEAEYVREVLDRVDGTKTTEPAPSEGAAGILVTFKARGSAEAPLTKERAIKALKADRYIEVVPGAA